VVTGYHDKVFISDYSYFYVPLGRQALSDL